MGTSVTVTLVVVVVAVVAAGAAAGAPSPYRNLLHGTRGLVGEDHWGVNLTTPELIEAMGYPVEIHHTTTEDGYILELHRIPYGVVDGSSEGRPVAYLEHCLLCSSSDYIMNNPEKALAYILADAGYDVWLSNLRGNTYTRTHVSLSPDDVAFWQFSWDEMAYYDVPASIDYVLDHTGALDVFYIGWSMGTTVFWAMMSERPEYNQKVRAMAGMAPVAYCENAEGPLIELAPYSGDLDLVMTLMGEGELLPGDGLIDYLAENYCAVEDATAEICYNFIFLLCGPDADEIPKEYLPVILSHMPAGTSVHTLNHYAQSVLSGKFQKYDYGLVQNLIHYGQETAPLYNLSRVTAPVGLFWGNTDWLADPKDVARLAEELPNVALNFQVNKTEFNHLDFGWGIDADKYVYQYILEFFSNY